MKSLTQIKLLVFVLLVFFCYDSKAQYVLTNSLTCDVKVTYEMWDLSCGVCSWNTVTILAGNSLTLTNCTFSDICVIVQSVGGNNVNWYNHANSDGNCHPPSGTTGQSSTGQCSGGWNTTITPGPTGSWTIF